MKSLLRQLNDKRKIIIMPGVYDALSAKIAEHLSFNAVFQSGYSVSAGILGMIELTGGWKGLSINCNN